MSFNKSFYKTGSKLEEIKDKYLGDNSKKDEIYEQVSWIYQNANLIESLIDLEDLLQSTRLNTQELVLDIMKMNCSLQIIGLKLMNK